MECPKCGAEIDKSAMVCPNCKKVLKIVCPVCRTVNTKNTCRKCGEILVVKCSKCGKINLTKHSKCVKCGYSTEKSAIQGESNTEDFAVLKIEFPNLDIVKAKLGSNQLLTKFKANLDNMILNYMSSLGVRRQIVKDNTYIIRFNNVYTLSASANSAIMSSIELANMFTRLNVKLLRKKGIGLKCNLTILKRNVEDNPYDVATGFQADMVQISDNIETKALGYFQLMTDEDFYEYYNDKYKLETLNAVLVNGKMKQFYEINLSDFIKINEFVQESVELSTNEEIEVPKFVQSALVDQEKITKQTLDDENNVSEDELYSGELINFDEVNCAFYMTENIRVLDNVVDVLQEVPRGILAIKGSNMYQPYTLRLLSAVEETGIYNDIIPVTCHDGMKYAPYSFFKELISTIFEYAVSQKLFDTNDFSMFNNIDSSGLVKDLITCNQREMRNFEETRDEYFQVFARLMEAIPNSLIYIENFEKVDSSSMLALSQLFDHFEDFSVSYLITYDKDYALHKENHFLLSRPYYTEITLKPSPFEGIIASNKEFYKNVLNDFYFQRIAKYACGSTLFLDFAIQYLLESGVYSLTQYSIVMVNPKTIMIPSSLSQLMKRRLNLLKDDTRAIKFLTMAVLLGTRVDEKTLESFGFANWKVIVDKLAGMGYVFAYNNCMYFSNYAILRENLLDILKPEELKNIAKELLEIAFVEGMASPVRANLYEMMDLNEQVIYEWESLANINLSMGDFSSYLNCSGEIIKCLDKYASNWSQEELSQYKKSIYENISNNMFEYEPNETREIAEKTLTSLKDNNNITSFIELGTKMIQGAFYNGQYLYALNLTHKVLSVMDGVSLDPTAENFSLHFLILSMVHIKILFNIGAYDDCLDIGYNVLNALDLGKINNIQFSMLTIDEFKEMLVECIACIAISDVVSMKEDVSEFLDISGKLFDFIPQEFSLFIQLQNLLKGENVQLPPKPPEENVYTASIYHIIKAYAYFRNKPIEFAKEVYKTKLIAKDMGLYKLELFADLLVGYSYARLNSFKKASAIVYRVIMDAKEHGMNSIEHIGWYVMSILDIAQGKFDIAYGVLNNSTIFMEKTPISEYLTMLDKVNMYKVLMASKEPEKAQICMNQAVLIVQKYGLNINLNIDIEKLMVENQNAEVVQKFKPENATPKLQEESLSEKENIKIDTKTSPEEDNSSDDGFVNPEDFFS